jgi:anti-sigma B factor antagonist
MELVVTEYHHCDLIRISGRIDSYSAPQINTVLNALMVDDHYNIIVDLEDVSYLSSSGILTFVNTQRKLRRQNIGEVVFVNVPKLIFSSFELAGFNTIFVFCDDIPTAVGRF